MLQLPGVSQDSAASGDFHIRNEHANVQYRLNGILLPDGVSGFAQVLDEDLPHAEQLGLATCRLELLALPEIGGEGDDLATVFGLQPAKDNAGVEPAGIGEDHFLDRLACHCVSPRLPESGG